MSKKKNIERAKREGPFRQSTAPPATRYRCPFPGCDWTFTLEAGKPECCDKHRQMIQDYYFIQEHVHRTPKPVAGAPADPAQAEALKKTLGDRLGKQVVVLGDRQGRPAALVIPKPGMADEAVRQAAKEAETLKAVQDPGAAKP